MHIRNTQKTMAEVYKYPPDLCRISIYNLMLLILLIQWYSKDIL